MTVRIKASIIINKNMGTIISQVDLKGDLEFFFAGLLSLSKTNDFVSFEEVESVLLFFL